ncbi:MAG: aminopeptidase N [Flavobacterium sp.]|jgi:aminopeptidase N
MRVQSRSNTENCVSKNMKDGQPKSIELRDYEVPGYLIETTHLHFDIDDEATIVTAHLKMVKNPASTTTRSDLLLNGGPGLETKLISIDGRELLSNEYAITSDDLTLFSLPDAFELKTQVKIKPQDNTALEGLYQSGDMFCTQCEAEGFRNITWFMDRPDVMSKYTTTIRADKSKFPILLSNGNEIARKVDGDKQEVSWEDPFKKPSYLFALVAGDLEHIEDSFTTKSGREVTLQIFTEAHNIDKLDHAMTSLKNSMAWDEAVYGREYDLDIFMIVAVESFNMGAMENKGLNIFNTSCVLARPDTTTDAAYQRVESVVAHEYFHNWSGNRVTCRDWFQLSLKEGFTVLRDQQFSSDMGSAPVCRVQDVAVLRSAQFPEDAGPMAHPIRPDSYIEINNFYTATVYEKGAEVVRMIRTLLNPIEFRKGTDLYFDRHDGDAATTEDFVKAMEDASGIDLTQFRRWYSQAGTPTLTVTSEFDEQAQSFRLNVHQYSSPSAREGDQEKAPLHMPLAVALLDANGDDMKIDNTSVVEAKKNIAGILDDNQLTVILNLNEREQSFIFNNIKTKPIPSLLRGFSAPVKLKYEYTRDELLFLSSFDSDGFNRWEAGQRLAVDVIQDVIEQIQNNTEASVDDRLIKVCSNVLDQVIEDDQGDSPKKEKIDKEMLASMLIMPMENYLAELMDIADIDAIHQGREIVRQKIADSLKGKLLSVYKLNSSQKTYEPIAQDIAQRAIKNVCLSYLMLGDETEYLQLCLSQLASSNNMTDTSAAIRALVNSSSKEAVAEQDKALETFYNRWSDDALVIDQWFAIQASCTLPGAIDRVKKLMNHDAFTMKNPNRMRALVVSFSFLNHVGFHNKDGSGYEFLADSVIELNGINPQMAARVLSPLTRWRKYDADRQGLMKEQLERILASENLSPDVFEIASKSV